MNYFVDRGILLDIIKKYKLGYDVENNIVILLIV